MRVGIYKTGAEQTVVKLHTLRKIEIFAILLDRNNLVATIRRNANCY